MTHLTQWPRQLPLQLPIVRRVCRKTVCASVPGCQMQEMRTRRPNAARVQAFKIDSQKQQRLVWQLEKEREKYGQEASESTSKYMQVRAPFVQ